MALEFYKRRFRKPGKKMQYFLAFTVLLLALGIVALWVYVEHKMSLNNEGSESAPSSTIAETPYTANDEAYLLLIGTDDTQARFFLIHADPANAAIAVSTITDNQGSLNTLYQKSGAAQVVSHIASSLHVPLKHHMVLSAESIVKCGARLEDGVNVTLSAPLIYTQSDGSTMQLPVGEQNLNAQQLAAIIPHVDTPDLTAADVIVAILRRYLRTGRHLPTDVDTLFNNTQTSLRIDNFREYQDALAHLAAKNAEGLCSINASTISLSQP